MAKLIFFSFEKNNILEGSSFLVDREYILFDLQSIFLKEKKHLVLRYSHPQLSKSWRTNCGSKSIFPTESVPKHPKMRFQERKEYKIHGQNIVRTNLLQALCRLLGGYRGAIQDPFPQVSSSRILQYFHVVLSLQNKNIIASLTCAEFRILYNVAQQPCEKLHQYNKVRRCKFGQENH